VCGCSPKCRTCRGLATVRGFQVVNQVMHRQGADYDIRVEFVCPECGKQWRCTTSSIEEENQVVRALSRNREGSPA
jgi:hypothetical protein